MDRLFVIPDIHGHYNTFRAVLQKIDLTKSDKLYLLGDYIDRGKGSRAVVDLLMDLQAKGYQVFPLRGNHEQMLLDSSDTLEDFAVLSNKRKKPFLGANNRVDPLYLDFFRRLPYYYDLGDLILVHAGLNLSNSDIFSDKKEMLWARNFRNYRFVLQRTVVHGHDITSLPVIRQAIEQEEKVIPLDNGVYKRSREFGNLLCLEWNSRELIITPATE